ncbi:MAG: flagellar motor stator protein MotA [Acidobacteria bacterium]|nr:flagellar motor stator protein MotA [Acidobacteriota bacterium]
MLLIAGTIVVIASILGGYLMEHGVLALLVQPAELVIIGGAAGGTLLISTPPAVVKDLLAQLKRLLTPAPGRDDYKNLLAMLYQLFRVVQQSGVMALESHFEKPSDSPVLKRYPKFLANHSALGFLSDSAKVIISGGISPHDFEHLMSEDLEVRHKHAMSASATLQKVGDALPGLGIVAAVLGIVITMQAIDGPVEVIGEKVGAALVGTFLGILLSYGFVGPMATAMEHRVGDEANIEQCIMAGLLAIYKGCAPAIAVEFSRRVIPEESRPSFEETEQICRGTREMKEAA